MSIEKNNNSSIVPASMSQDVEVLKLPPFLRIKQVGLYFGINRKMLWRLLSNPRSGVKGHKINRIVLVRTTSILRMLKKTAMEGNHNHETT